MHTPAMSEMEHEPALEARVREITSPEFIEGVVYPTGCGASGGARLPAACEPSVIQNRGTGRVTIQYRFRDTTIYGKLYSDGLGAHSSRILAELWDTGFGDDQIYRVARPLLYLPEPNLLLLGAAQGVPLMSFLGQDTPDVRRHVRQAARWLVRLHRAPLRIGRSESLWDSLKLLRIVRRLTKAAARAPQERTRLRDMIDALCDKGREIPEGPFHVQTHGRFHLEHIFANGETITLIDPDQSRPSDPAKDLAEFVSVLRLRTFKHTGTAATADAPTRIFLDEYLSQLPANGRTLAVHWGAFLLLNMLHYVKKCDPAHEAFQPMMRFYQGEFDAALRGTFVGGAYTRRAAVSPSASSAWFP